MDLISMLSARNYIIANKEIAKLFGIEEAILLGELCSELKYWAENGKITADGYFFSTVENVKENTTLSDRRQRAAIKTLKDAGILDVKLSGLPAKRYIKINEEQLAALLLNSNAQNAKTSSDETQELGIAKRNCNNNNINDNKNNNKNNNNYIIVIDYLNQKAGTAYKPTSKATQQHINARLAEGFTVDDFKRVIDNKCADWLGTEWEQYLRPATLFGTKFESYLNRKTVSKGVNGVAISGEGTSELDGLF